ncbi:MAG TPA: hypothetical protein DDY32_08510 [Desulfobulbaceae bacterium]|nr:hypothetical protein [Desulfobulbaceae bacterium]
MVKKILGKDFIGPLSLEGSDFPDDLPAVYFIGLKDSEFPEPLYVSLTDDLQKRIKQHLLTGVIEDKALDTSLVALYYWKFDTEKREEAQNLERTLIHNFRPSFNLRKYDEKRIKIETERQKYEKTRKYTSVVAGLLSSIALGITVSIYFWGIFDKNQITNISDFSQKMAHIEHELQIEQKKQFDLITHEVNSIKTHLSNISKLPPNTELSVELNETKNKVVSLEAKIQSLESAILADPTKALAVPLLRKDLENTREKFSTEISQAKLEIERIYDLTKWFIGLMFTIALSVLGMAVNSFYNKNKS